MTTTTTTSMAAELQESGMQSGKVNPELKEIHSTKSSMKVLSNSDGSSEPGRKSRKTIEVIVPVKGDKTSSSRRKSEAPIDSKEPSTGRRQSRRSQLINASLVPVKRPSMASRKSLKGPQDDTSSSTTKRAKAVPTLQPCRLFQDRRSPSIENLDRPIDHPLRPVKFTPPIRRNFRYRGYPADLNLDLYTPPRVRSWGPLDEIQDPRNPTLPEDLTAKLKINKSRPSPSSKKFVADESFDPTWVSRTIKRNLLLANPGLLPILGRTNLGGNSADRVNIVKPTLDLTNCVSDLYFPLADKSRKAFCKINKITKEALKKKPMTTTLQLQEQGEAIAPTISRKTLFFEQPGLWKRHQSKVLEAKTSETIFYEQAEVTPMMKMFCLEESGRPGMNKQLYGRPTEKVEVVESDAETLFQKPETGVIRMPIFDLELPDDVWEKLSKVRIQKHHMRQIQKKLLATLEGEDKFETFTQLELRNKVMNDVCQTFLEKFRANTDAPLPPELFEDNRDQRQPYHDFVEKDELPPQGPFVWKVEPEPDPTPEELAIVEKYIEKAKETHTFTHHLPGRSYEVRHPYPEIELDWIAKDEVLPQEEEATEFPLDTHDYPSYVMNLSPTEFQGKLMKILEEGVKGVIGEKVVKAFHDQRGLYYEKGSKKEKEKAAEKQEEPLVEEILAPKEVEEEIEAVASSPALAQRRVCPCKIRAPQENPEEEVEEEASALQAKSETKIEKEEDISASGEQSEEKIDKGKKMRKKRKSPGKLDWGSAFRLSVDLMMLDKEHDEMQSPLPGIRFSEITFPLDNYPPELKEDMKLYRKQMAKGEPIRPSREDLHSEHDSDTPSESTEIEQQLTEDQDGSGETNHSHSSHNPLPRLQSLYMSGVKRKFKSLHRKPTLKELEPPRLKNIWQEDYTEDIEHLLKQNYTQHSFSKYMLESEL